MKKRNLYFKKTLIILFSLSLIALISYFISFAFINNNTSYFGLVNHDTVIAIKAGEAVSPPPITEQAWFVPVIASCVGLFALCIILGLGIGIPIAKKKEKKLLAERRENEALMQRIQEVSEEEAALSAEQQKTEELNNKEETHEVHSEDNHSAVAVSQQPVPSAMPMNPNFGPMQMQPNIAAFGGVNPQVMQGNPMQQRPGFNPALANNPNNRPGAYPQMMNRQQQGFVNNNPMMNRVGAVPAAANNQQRFNSVGQQRPMQQMPFNNQQRSGGIAPQANHQQPQMRPLPQQGGYGPVAGAAALRNASGQQSQQFGPRPMPQR